MFSCVEIEITNNDNNISNIESLKNLLETIYDNIDSLSPFIVSKERKKEKIISDYNKEREILKSEFEIIKRSFTEMNEKLTKEKIRNSVFKNLIETSENLKVNKKFTPEYKSKIKGIVDVISFDDISLEKLKDIENKIKKILN